MEIQEWSYKQRSRSGAVRVAIQEWSCGIRYLFLLEEWMGIAVADDQAVR